MTARLEGRAGWLVRAALATCVTLAVLCVVILKARPEAVLDVLSHADPIWILAALVVALASSTLQSAEALRWCLRGFDAAVPYRQVLAATAGNMAIKAALPAGTGEAARVAWLKRTCDVDPLRSTAAIAALLWLKLAGLAALALSGWAMLPVRDPVRGACVAAGALLVVLLPVAAVRWGRARAAHGASGWRRIPHALASTLARARPGALAIGAAHALLSVTLEIAVFAMLLHSLGGRVDVAEILASLPLVVVGAKVPVTILGLGTREGLTVILLAGTNAGEVLAGAALLFSAVKYVLPALVGSALTWHYVRRIAGGP
jgi:uncharacterized membrane protein YbhN (UPF0104 family)